MSAHPHLCVPPGENPGLWALESAMDELAWELNIDPVELRLNPAGVRGVGEIGITGVSAAIANAIYHATGKRIRHLPITPDKIL